MNRAFHSLSPTRQAGLRDVIRAARQHGRQRDILRDQSEARAHRLDDGGAIAWELRTDESGVIAKGVWPHDLALSSIAAAVLITSRAPKIARGKRHEHR